MSKVVYKASCWDCDDFYIGTTKRRLHDKKKRNILRPLLKAVTLQQLLITLTSTAIILNGIILTFFATGRSDIHFKIKETLLIRH